MREIVRRAGELLSLFSCLLNVLVGTGDREVTLSAGSWELRRRGSRWGALIVWLRGADHCRKAWEDHAPVWEKVQAEVQP